MSGLLRRKLTEALGVPAAIEADETDESDAGELDLPVEAVVSTTSSKVFLKGRNCKKEGAGEDSAKAKGKGVTAGENVCIIEGSTDGEYDAKFNSDGDGEASGEDKLLKRVLFNEQGASGS